jgi:sec-independent protein translocase protein TatA
MFEMKHLIVVLLVVLLVFGAKKLRTIGSDLGAAVRGFKQSVNEGEADAAARQIRTEGTDAEFPDAGARAAAAEKRDRPV